MEHQHEATRSHGVGIGRARVLRADGTTEIHYSLPDVAWWNFKARAWVRRRLKVMREEDRTWTPQS